MPSTTSTSMEIVNDIKAKLAALPAEYQALITGEKTYTQAHPIVSVSISFLAGLALGFLLFKVL